MNNGISMYYTSNDRDYSALSTCIFISENKHESKNMYMKMYFFVLNFSFVHISTNNVIEICETWRYDLPRRMLP